MFYGACARLNRRAEAPAAAMEAGFSRGKPRDPLRDRRGRPGMLIYLTYEALRGADGGQRALIARKSSTREELDRRAQACPPTPV
jgi:hypothetical protein